MEIISNFAVFEGGDGSGTTTQLSLLTERMKNVQSPFFFPTFEPTGTQTGNLIRAALKREIVLKPETLAVLFAADRNEHLYGLGGIAEHAAGGELIVSDRYILSSLVYQGIECGDELPQTLNSRFPFPELTIFLDIKPEIAIDRMKDRTSLEIYEHLDFQKKVYDKYLSVLEIYSKAGGRVETIDASKNTREVADQVWRVISQMPIFNV
ncbi:MAG: dTMP kinase [Treponema sp.]|nr:dTMP kinase [Treponema sp.]